MKLIARRWLNISKYTVKDTEDKQQVINGLTEKG